MEVTDPKEIALGNIGRIQGLRQQHQGEAECLQDSTETIQRV